MASPERYYRAALICGLAPLMSGVAIFLLWTLVRWDGLMFAGLATIFGGIASVGLGIACVVAYAITSRNAEPDKRFGVRVAVAMAALLVNFPAYALVMITVAYVITRADLTVVNNGPEIAQLVLSGACTQVNFGAIASGSRRAARIDIARDGALEFHARRGEEEVAGVVEAYVTPGQGLNLELVFSRDGDWSVRNLDTVHE